MNRYEKKENKVPKYIFKMFRPSVKLYTKVYIQMYERM